MGKGEDILIDKYKKYVLEREIYFDYTKEYETFASSILKHCRSILIENNTSFSFERKGNSREGALTQKRLKFKIDNKDMLVKVIKIRSDVEFILQIHTFFHELVHLINNHNNQDMNDISLSISQKEYVAEVSAQALLYSFVGGRMIDSLPSNKKGDQSKYISTGIKNAKMSEKKVNEMGRQIIYAYEFISKTILNVIKDK